jgi:hypothetical protein
MGFEGTIGGGAAYVRPLPPFAAYVRLWLPMTFSWNPAGVPGAIRASHLSVCDVGALFVHTNKCLYTVRGDP